MDDCLIAGALSAVAIGKEETKSHFDCNNVGRMEEYVGCKVQYNASRCTMTLTQLVLLQSFQDKFGVTLDGHVPAMLAVPSTVLCCGEDCNHLPQDC